MTDIKNTDKPFYIDVYENGNEIVYWTRHNERGIERHIVPSSDYCYCFQPDNTGKGEFKNIDNIPMNKMFFKNKWDMRNYAKQRDDLCESDVQITQKFMIDEFTGADLDSPYNAMFWDIEVDFDLNEGKGYPTPENPYGEINSIQLYDVVNRTYIMIMPIEHKGNVKLKDDEDPVEILYSRNEREMLQIFAEIIEDVDYLTGWFTAGFDTPYLIKRAEMNFGKKIAHSMFCRDGYPLTTRTYVNDFAQEVTEYQLVGRKQVDMLELYKKFVPGEKPNFKLDTIVEIELGESKIDYDDDLGALYRENPQKFYDYAIHDVRLLKMLNERRSIIPLAVMIARQQKVLIDDVLGTVKPIEAGFIQYCRKVGNYVLPDKKENTSEKFDGAIVYETINGSYDWSASFDLVSLYPSVMMMLGLSTENFLYQLKNRRHDFISVVEGRNTPVFLICKKSGGIIESTAKEVQELIRAEGYTLSANGSIFSGGTGLLDGYVSETFRERKKYQAMMREYRNKGEHALAVTYNLFQEVKKIIANSLYGCISNAYFVLYDIDMALSITLTGQMISKHQAVTVNNLLEEFI